MSVPTDDGQRGFGRCLRGGLVCGLLRMQLLEHLRVPRTALGVPVQQGRAKRFEILGNA